MLKVTKNNGFNIVVLDNSETYVKLWEKILKSIPEVSSYITDNVKTACDIIKNNKIDLVISEVVLDHSDGYTIAEVAHKENPATNVILTTAFDCDLSRFNIKNPKFAILYKPYNQIGDIKKFISRLLKHEDVFEEVSEDSFSENEVFPEVMEWKL